MNILGIALGATLLLSQAIGCGRLRFEQLSAEPSDAVSANVDVTMGEKSYYQTVKDDNPVGYWRLNDTGTTAADEMNQHLGVISGPCANVTRGFLASDADGAMAFDNNCVISLGDSFEFLGQAPYSIEAWVLTENNSISRHIFSRQVRTTSPNVPIEGYALVLDNFALYQERASGGINVQSTLHATTVNAVVHTVTTYDGTQMRLFADGLAAGDAVVTTVGMQSITAETLIGCSVRDSQCFIGTIDEVSIYDYALTDAQIASHYAAGIR
jgi:hypothetical protein